MSIESEAGNGAFVWQNTPVYVSWNAGGETVDLVGVIVSCVHTCIRGRPQTINKAMPLGVDRAYV